MNCGIKLEECDFVREFMDLEEFFAATTTDGTSAHPMQSPYETNITASRQEAGDQASIGSTNSLLNEQHDLPGRNIVNDCLVSVQEVPEMDEPLSDQLQVNFNNLRERNDSSSSCDTITADTRSTADIQDCNLSLTTMGNSVNKDKRYWDRRLKNNIAAKRSRDAKRLKETTVVKRWSFLEEENKRLKEEIVNMQRRLKAVTGGEDNPPI